MINRGNIDTHTRAYVLMNILAKKKILMLVPQMSNMMSYHTTELFCEKK